MIDTIILNSNATSWEELFDEVSQYLLEKGIVKSGYKEFLIKREKEFPTGLKFSDTFAIALPHADIQYSNKQCVVLVKPNKDVKFNRMDEKSETVKVDLVVFLIITDANSYNKFLSGLLELLQNIEIQKIIKEGKLDLVAEEIKKLSQN